MQKIYCKLFARRVALSFESRLSQWRALVVSVPCSFHCIGFVKEMRGGVGLMAAQFSKKIISGCCCFKDCRFTYLVFCFLSYIFSIFMTILDFKLFTLCTYLKLAKCQITLILLLSKLQACMSYFPCDLTVAKSVIIKVQHSSSTQSFHHTHSVLVKHQLV